MENQQANVPTQCNGDWFDNNILSTEFELPTVSSPMDAAWFDDNASFFSENQLETLPSPVNASVLDTKDSFTIGVQLPIVPSSTNAPSFPDAPLFISNSSFSMENHQVNVASPNTPWFGLNASFPLGNHLAQVHSLRDQEVHVPIRSANTPCLGSNGSISMTNKQVHVSSFVNSSWSRSNGSFPIRDQHTLLPSSAYATFGSNGSVFVRNQHTDVSSSGSIGSLSIKHQQASVRIFGNAHSLGSNGFHPMRNQLARVPWSGSNGSLSMQNHFGLVPNSTSRPLFGSNIRSLPVRNQLGLVPSLTRARPFNFFPKQNQQSSASWLNAYREVPIKNQQIFGQRRLHTPWINYDDIHVCSTCHKMFPTTHALGGHMSSHTKAKKRAAIMADLVTKSENHNVVNLSKSGLTTNVSSINNYLLGIVEKKIKYLKRPDKRLSNPPGDEVIAKKLFSPLHEIFKQGSSSVNDVCKQEGSSGKIIIKQENPQEDHENALKQDCPEEINVVLKECPPGDEDAMNKQDFPVELEEKGYISDETVTSELQMRKEEGNSDVERQGAISEDSSCML